MNRSQEKAAKSFVIGACALFIGATLAGGLSALYFTVVGFLIIGGLFTLIWGLLELLE
jgi:uncharacterized membrane protein YccC